MFCKRSSFVYCNQSKFRVLGFNRVPPVIGRVFNITNDLRLKATEELARTFFSSPGLILFLVSIANTIDYSCKKMSIKTFQLTIFVFVATVHTIVTQLMLYAENRAII